MGHGPDFGWLFPVGDAGFYSKWNLHSHTGGSEISSVKWTKALWLTLTLWCHSVFVTQPQVLMRRSAAPTDHKKTQSAAGKHLLNRSSSSHPKLLLLLKFGGAFGLKWKELAPKFLTKRQRTARLWAELAKQHSRQCAPGSLPPSHQGCTCC